MPVTRSQLNAIREEDFPRAEALDDDLAEMEELRAEESTNSVRTSASVKDPNVHCCNCKMSRKLVVYLTQFLMAMSIVIFSFTQLAIAKGACDSQSFYGPIITMILGTFLPTPQIGSSTLAPTIAA